MYKRQQKQNIINGDNNYCVNYCICYTSTESTIESMYLQNHKNYKSRTEVVRWAKFTNTDWFVSISTSLEHTRRTLHTHPHTLVTDTIEPFTHIHTRSSQT